MTWQEFENVVYTDFRGVLEAKGFINGDTISQEVLSKARKTPFFRSINNVEQTQTKTCLIYEVTNFNGRHWADNQVTDVDVIFGLDIVTPDSLESQRFQQIRADLEEAFENTEWRLVYDSTFYDYNSKKSVVTYTARKVFKK